MEIGSIGSALTYFRNDVVRVFRDRKLLVFLVVVTLVTGIVGVPLFLVSEKLLANAYNVGYPMLALGLILIGDGIYIMVSREKRREKTFKEMNLRDMVIVGVMQGLAALPGVSRSGMTVSTMLLLGYAPEDAFRYSYLAYIPAALGAFGVTLVFSRHEIQAVSSQLTPEGIVFAVITAFITGLLVIGSLLRIAKKTKVYVINFVLGTLAIIGSLVIIAYYGSLTHLNVSLT
jgi:undecaprenyl-diphosphatase